MYNYNCDVLLVVDGDTIDVEIDLGFKVYTKIRLRLNGIDTPEKHIIAQREKALAARDFLRAKLAEYKNECVIKSIKTEKYGRWLADVFVGQEALSVNDIMIKEGHAKPYNGGKRDG